MPRLKIHFDRPPPKEGEVHTAVFPLKAKGKIFPKGYWAVPDLPNAGKGDEDKDRLYTAVGEAATAWEWVQTELAWLYLLFCQTPALSSHANGYVEPLLWPNDISWEVARSTFARTESMGGRRSLISHAASVYFGHYWEHDSIKQPFDAVMSEIEKGSFRRNEILHGQAMQFQTTKLEFKPDGTSQIVYEDYHGCYLVAPDYAAHREIPFANQFMSPDKQYVQIGNLRIISQYVYIAETVTKIAHQFNELRWTIAEYRKFLGKPACLD